MQPVTKLIFQNDFGFEPPTNDAPALIRGYLRAFQLPENCPGRHAPPAARPLVFSLCSHLATSSLAVTPPLRHPHSVAPGSGEGGSERRERVVPSGAVRCGGGTRRFLLVTGGPFRRRHGGKRREAGWNDGKRDGNGPPRARCRA